MSKRREMHGRCVKHFYRLGAPRDRGRNGVTNSARVSNGAKHELRARFIGNHVWCAPAGNSADVQGALSQNWILWQRNFANAMQNIQQGVNRGVAQFRVSRMREHPVRNNFVTKRTFRTQRHSILSRLSINEESRSTRTAGSDLRPGAVALFSDYEQQRK